MAPKRKAVAAPGAAPPKQRKKAGAKKMPPTDWTVLRLAAKSASQRIKEGGAKSQQKKIVCHKLVLRKGGAVGEARGWFFGRTYQIEDYNNYRTGGHTGRFVAGTPDRAVSVGTIAAYETLRTALGPHGRLVSDGDLGENILLRGPPALASDDGLHVGLRLRVGSALIELTEANNPCYRFNTQPWAKHAQVLWGATAPEPAKWFKSPECPLDNVASPGIRGWLAKVIEEGEVSNGAAVERA